MTTFTPREALNAVAKQADRDLAQANEAILRQARRIHATSGDIINRLTAGHAPHLVLLNDCDGQYIASQAAELASALGKRAAARELVIGVTGLAGMLEGTPVTEGLKTATPDAPEAAALIIDAADAALDSTDIGGLLFNGMAIALGAILSADETPAAELLQEVLLRTADKGPRS